MNPLLFFFSSGGALGWHPPHVAHQASCSFLCPQVALWVREASLIHAPLLQPHSFTLKLNKACRLAGLYEGSRITAWLWLPVPAGVLGSCPSCKFGLWANTRLSQCKFNTWLAGGGGRVDNDYLSNRFFPLNVFPAKKQTNKQTMFVPPK